jgi:hypothetical protein
MKLMPQEQAPEEPLPELEFQILDLTTESLPPEPPSAGQTGSADSAAEEKVRSHSTSTKPPTADEWTDFLGLTVFRLLTEGYLQLFLWRYVDESDLSPREREMIHLSKEELCDMAAPLGTVASKNKLARKHGRTIIASAEAYESMIDMFFWMKRVGKIARKYRKQQFTASPDDVVEGNIYNGSVPATDGTPGSTGTTARPNIGGIIPGTGG